jgi:hypothetical protein
MRRTITTSQRFGVWTAWDGRCFWCRKPVEFQHCEVDHVIPLDAVKTDADAAAARKMYSLPRDFDFDCFGNWVPACSSCNRSKSFTIIDPSPAFALHLSSIKSRSLVAKNTSDGIDADRPKAKLLAQVEAAIRAGKISQNDLTGLFQGLPATVKTPDTWSSGLPQQQVFQLAPGWSVVRTDGHLQIVTDGVRAGMTSSSNDPSWTCSRCGNKGPWNGVICLSCGNREEPD